MREAHFGPLNVRLAGGTDREGGGTGPLIVLMHGFGAPGNDLVPLWRALNVPSDVRFAFPEGPLSLDLGFGESRAWWQIDMLRLQHAMLRGEMRRLADEVPPGLADARTQLVTTLAALQSDLEVPAGQLVLGGFSQGAMLACDLTLHTDRAVAGLVLLSASLLAEEEWVPRMVSRKGLPVFQSHGDQDPVLPFVMAEALRDRLTQAGLPVSWWPFRGGHGIPPQVLDELGVFLTQVLGDAADGAHLA